MKRIDRLPCFLLLAGLALAGPTAATPERFEEGDSTVRAPVAKQAPPEDPKERFCRGWRQLKRGMPFEEARTLGIEMDGSCTPGEPQSFHQPYMDLYFDAECRALHGATTLPC